MGLGIGGIGFYLSCFIHVSEWFHVSFILSFKAYGFNLWVYSQLGYQKGVSKFLKIGKDNFGFYLFTSL